MQDVQARFTELSAQHRALRWFALIDGYQYEQHTGQRITPIPGVNRALFDGTEDESLAHAGPWLHDLSQDRQLANELAAMEQARPAVSWLIAATDLETLARRLQSKLDGKLPDGRKILVRFYDPRVLGNLFNVMHARQRAEFFDQIEEWHFLYEGKRVWTGRTNA